MKHRKIYILHTFLLLCLIAVDELVKWYIVFVKGAEIDTCNSTGQLIHFHPTYNKAGNFLALQLGTEISRIVFIIMAFVLSAVVMVLTVWCMRKLSAFGKSNGAYMVPFSVLLAGTLGRVVERCFWAHTLDYIAIKGLAICDLLDIYLFAGAFGVCAVGLYIDYLEKKNVK